MTKLIIDATSGKVFFMIIMNNNNYNISYENSKKNYEKLTILLNDFLMSKNLNFKKICKIYVNRGPGSFAGVRSSISIAKGFHISQNIDYYCFSFLDFINIKKSEKNQIIKDSSLLSQFHNIKYEKIPELCRKHKIKKNLIKPLYLS